MCRMRCIERGNRDGVLDARADVADPELDGRVSGRRADIPADLASVLDRLDAPVCLDDPRVLDLAADRRRQPGAREGTHRGLAVDFSPVSRPAWNGDDVDSASMSGRYSSSASITLIRRSGVPKPAWMCMPPMKNCRTVSWYSAAARRYRSFSVTCCACHRAHGCVDEAMTRAPWLRAASMTALRVSRRLCASSPTDWQTFELVSICERMNSLTTRWGAARSRACSKMSGSGSVMTSRVPGSTIISSSSSPMVISIRVSGRPRTARNRRDGRAI